MPKIDRRPGADPPALETALAEAFGRVPQEISRAASGVSTAVYRVVVDGLTYYARLAEERTDDLRIDARVLIELNAVGVRAPVVVHVSTEDTHVGRSVLITTEIAGSPLVSAPGAHSAQIAREAGHDLALIHRLPVAGFGFIRRDRLIWPPLGAFSTYEAFVHAVLPDPWPGPFASIFKPACLRGIRSIVELEQNRALPSATFAHGDFDLTHIFTLDGRSAESEAWSRPTFEKPKPVHDRRTSDLVSIDPIQEFAQRIDALLDRL